MGTIHLSGFPLSGDPKRDDADRRTDLGFIQAPLAAHTDILECVLQLRPLYRLPRADHPGPKMSDPVHSPANHLGVLLPAVLSYARQHLGRTLQENVSMAYGPVNDCGMDHLKDETDQQITN